MPIYGRYASTKIRPAENYICHVVLILDASGSMAGHADELIQVVDTQIKYLARRSQELGQEVRVTVYVFHDTVTCVIYDMDVLRLPSVKELYELGGMTALIDATLMAIGDLSETPQRHGKHGFLVYAFSDGRNNIHDGRAPELARTLAGLPENWTVAALVPGQMEARQAEHYGFQAHNVAMWSTTDPQGVTVVGEVIKQATDTYMTNLSQGTYTRSLFSTAPDALNKQTVKAANLQVIEPTKYELLPVGHVEEIQAFVERSGRTYVPGSCYYQLNKSEMIGGRKKILVREVSTGKILTGDVRGLIGLGTESRRVRPGFNPEYEIFPQSTSTNRHLVPGTVLLVMR